MKTANKFLARLLSLLVVASLLAFGPGALSAKAVGADKKVRMGQSVSWEFGDVFNSNQIAELANDSEASVTVSVSWLGLDGLSSSLLISQVDFMVNDLDFSTLSSTSFEWDSKCNRSQDSCLYAFGSYFAKPGKYTVDVATYNSVSAGTPVSSFQGGLTVTAANLLKITLKKKVVFPYSDGYLDTIQGKVQGMSPDGFSISVGGKTAYILSGKKKIGSGRLTPAGNFVIRIPQLTKGKLTIDLSLLHAKSNGRDSSLAKGSSTVVAKTTGVSKLTVSGPTSIFPAKDGYLDKGVFGARLTTSTGKFSNISGILKISQGSKTVVTRSLVNQSANSFTWDGKVGGRIVPGAYLFTASVKGPQGEAKVKSIRVVVSGKKRVTVTVNQTYCAYDAVYEDQGDSYNPVDPDGACGARFYSSGDPDTMVVAIAIPKSPDAKSWRIKFNDYNSYGYFTYFPCSNSDCLSSYKTASSHTFSDGDSGSLWTKWTQAGQGSGTAYFSIGSVDWASIYVESFTIQYSKTVLR